MSICLIPIFSIRCLIPIFSTPQNGKFKNTVVDRQLTASIRYGANEQREPEKLIYAFGPLVWLESYPKVPCIVASYIDACLITLQEHRYLHYNPIDPTGLLHYPNLEFLIG
jgi:hypothetical protein